MADIRIGTSAFTAEGWVGSFYPAGMQPCDGDAIYGLVERETIEGLLVHGGSKNSIEQRRVSASKLASFVRGESSIKATIEVLPE